MNLSPLPSRSCPFNSYRWSSFTLIERDRTVTNEFINQISWQFCCVCFHSFNRSLSRRCIDKMMLVMLLFSQCHQILASVIYTCLFSEFTLLILFASLNWIENVLFFLHVRNPLVNDNSNKNSEYWDTILKSMKFHSEWQPKNMRQLWLFN